MPQHPTGRSVGTVAVLSANWSSRDSVVAINQAPSQANDLTSQSSGFIVKQRGPHGLANDSPSFTPVHSRIRANGPQNLHLAKGRGLLRPHSVLVLRDGDTLNLIAERYGTTVATLRRINPQLESTQTITSVDGDSLAVLAGRHGTTETKLRSLNPVLQQSESYVTGEGETLSSVAAEQNLSLSLLRQFNPELSSWPSEEPLPTGSTLLLPVYRSTTPIPAGMQLLVPGYMPSTPLPAGEWIHLPARRLAAAVEEGVESLG